MTADEPQSAPQEVPRLGFYHPVTGRPCTWPEALSAQGNLTHDELNLTDEFDVVYDRVIITTTYLWTNSNPDRILHPHSPPWLWETRVLRGPYGGCVVFAARRDDAVRNHEAARKLIRTVPCRTAMEAQARWREVMDEEFLFRG